MYEYAASWLNFEETLGGVRPVLRGTAQDMRAQYDGLLSFLSLQHPPTSDEVKVNQDRVSGIEYRTYIPHASETRQLPIGVFYHSGGLVVGSLDNEDAFCRQVALRANVVIVNVGYPLPPKHKAPAHLEDAVTLYEWVYENAQQIGGDRSRIFAIGTSAGGALALAVTRMVAIGKSTIPADSVKGIAMLCPVTLHPLNVPAKYKAVYLSYEKKENAPVVDQTSLM
ncbi:sterigmatocystin biosynthesis lipase esterase stcI [Fusarium albosuccineum]|uniref:Sterigmatocystin biosynthesis lipase esterase stcI n=1 Tax=Fusarium albosuccineum TaxID=1237068 RepID=A0A8H4PGE4_9HYPO|nr:sterigmatocystin biosynthesis lipase esterase stcI [Fusarium albosuccineum]